jgi:hypothetical protein
MFLGIALIEPVLRIRVHLDPLPFPLACPLAIFPPAIPLVLDARIGWQHPPAPKTSKNLRHDVPPEHHNDGSKSKEKELTAERKREEKTG